MSTQLDLSAPPMPSLRPTELGRTGLQGRGARMRVDIRAELRALFTHSSGRHRVTFVPLDHYAMRMD